MRATYGARVLGEIARDRSRVPAPGEWVTLRRWSDGPVTVEATHGRRPAPALAEVVPLRPGRLRVAPEPSPPACHAARVGNVTLPTPVFLAGGALCVVAGMLVGGVVALPRHARTAPRARWSATTPSRSRLCLEGDGIKDQEGVDDNGHLCGTLRRTPNSGLPVKGDDFRFVSVRTTGELNGKAQQEVVIYGDVVD